MSWIQVFLKMSELVVVLATSFLNTRLYGLHRVARELRIDIKLILAVAVSVPNALSSNLEI